MKHSKILTLKVKIMTIHLKILAQFLLKRGF